MHSSRMRIDRLGGGCASQQDFLGGKEIGKNRKKNSDTPRKFQTHPRKFQTRPPPKISDTPPKISDQTPIPPQNFRPDTPPKCFRHHTPPRTRPGTPSPPVDRHTPVNLLPWPNFVAAGKNDYILKYVSLN